MVAVFSMSLAVNAVVVCGVSEHSDDGTQHWQCGNYDTKMECPSYATGLCHSGTNPECSNSAWCGGGTYAAIQCSDDTTDVNKGDSHWLWGSYGDHLSCISTSNAAATGACGGGMNPDCESGSYFGIDCADNNVKVLEETCEWSYHTYGEYAECPADSDRPILAGSCSGGANPDCNGQYFGTFCCAEHSTVNNVVGRWEATPIYSSGTTTISFSAGTQVTNTLSKTETTGQTMQKSVERGLTVEGASRKITLTKTRSESLATQHSQSFQRSLTAGVSTELPAGIVWQWRYNADLNRGTGSTWSMAVVATNSADEPPCCLPGYFLHADDPTGLCQPGEVDLCRDTLAV